MSYISYFVAPLIAPQVIFKSLPASPLAEVVMPETLRLSVSEAPCGRYANCNQHCRLCRALCLCLNIATCNSCRRMGCCCYNAQAKCCISCRAKHRLFDFPKAFACINACIIACALNFIAKRFCICRKHCFVYRTAAPSIIKSAAVAHSGKFVIIKTGKSIE